MYSVGDSVSDAPIQEPAYIVIDRLVVADTEDFKKRCRDSPETTYRIGRGQAGVYNLENKKIKLYRESAACPICDYELQDLTISNFSFNSHYGACEACSGLGTEIAFLEEKVVNPRLTLAEGALLPWAAHPYYTKVLEAMCARHTIPLDIRYEDLSSAHKEKILHGTPGEYYEVTPE